MVSEPRRRSQCEQLFGRTPLAAAMQYAPLSVIEMLFAHGGDITQSHLLHAAVARKNQQLEGDRKTVIDYLIRKGASVNAVKFHDRPHAYAARKPFGLATPLHEAAAEGAEDAVRILLSYGARTDIRDSCGDLAVKRAEFNGHGSVARYLREQQASLSRL